MRSGSDGLALRVCKFLIVVSDMIPSVRVQDRQASRKRGNNPRDWTIDDLKTLARRYGLDWRQPGTSHVTSSAAGRTPLTVPSHKPIKPLYVVRFVSLIDSLGDAHGD